jgi:hypothetical protein
MKAYRAEFEDSGWCILVHGETRGKAKSRFMQVQPDPWLADTDYWNDIRLLRIPGLDNKPITFANTAAAEFFYVDSETDKILDANEFFNFCDCEICGGNA